MLFAAELNDVVLRRAARRIETHVTAGTRGLNSSGAVDVNLPLTRICVVRKNQPVPLAIANIDGRRVLAFRTTIGMAHESGLAID